MKRLLPLLLVLALLPAGAALAAGETYTCGNYRYVLLEDGSALLIAYLGTDAVAVLPLELDGHPVTGARGNPFASMYDFSWHLKECTVDVPEDHPHLAVVEGVLFGRADAVLIWRPRLLPEHSYAVPEGTRVIGRHAFYADHALTGVALPEGVTQIGNYAFGGCDKLTEVNLPEGVTELGDCAFIGCASLASLALPASLAHIGWHCFDGCGSLVLTVFPGSWAEAWCEEHGFPHETAPV